MPIDNRMSLVSGLGDVCLCRIAVKCLSVAPGKLSICMSSIFLFGMRARLESPVKIMFFLIGRDHMVALRFVGGCTEGWWKETLSLGDEKREGEVVVWRLGPFPTGARATTVGVVRGGVRGQG